MAPRTALLLTGSLLAACAPVNAGIPGDPTVTRPAIDGTVFTIVFENENADRVLVPSNPTFYEMSRAYATAAAYQTDIHPSLANYIVMTSGQTHGINSSDDPESNRRLDGTGNLGEQLDGAQVRWRAYMESMGEPCNAHTTYPYKVNHNPFVYYTSLANDPERCADRVVDLDANFERDLASGDYGFMFLVPNNCNNMHDCSEEVADAWLAEKLALIMDSEGYRNGGVIFVLFDEGHLRILDAGANVPAFVISERLRDRPIVTNTRFDHRSYLATIEDIFEMPRLPTTVDAVPMGELFVEREP